MWRQGVRNTGKSGGSLSKGCSEQYNAAFRQDVATAPPHSLVPHSESERKRSSQVSHQLNFEKASTLLD